MMSRFININMNIVILLCKCINMQRMFLFCKQMKPNELCISIISSFNLFS